MNTFGIDGFFTGLVYLILVAAGLGVLVSVPAFFVAGAIGLGSKLLGKKSTNDDPALDADIMDVKKDFEKAIKEYNITSELVKIQIMDELLAKKNLMFDAKTNTFKRRMP